MKLTGPACTEATSEAEEAERRGRAEDSADGVRVERRVRRMGMVACEHMHARNHAAETKKGENLNRCSPYSFGVGENLTSFSRRPFTASL